MSVLITVLGAGESGAGAALLAKAKGFSVFVSDSGKIKENYLKILQSEKFEYEENGHNEQLILSSSLVIKSPGIADASDIIRKISAKNIPVISEIEFASRYTKARFIAITGSNGKTTTTMLTYHLLKKCGLNVGLAGNIGESLAKQVVQDRHEYYVLELSSFQLDGMFEFKAHVAILLNITPDHLDRYENKFQNYVNSKFRIARNMDKKDFLIAFTDDETIKNELDARNLPTAVLSVSLKEKVLNGAYLSEGNIMVNLSDPDSSYFHIPVSAVPLKGKHNLVNAMSAILSASVLGLPESKFEEALSDFRNAPHRLENVAEVNGISFINDSKATNVDAVWYALDSMERPVVLIAGGIDKGNDYSRIEKVVKKKVKTVVCLGTDNSKLHKAFEGKVELIDTVNIHDAVSKAFMAAAEGDVVLLSPACASFDLFRNYEDRGDQFRQEVLQLKEIHQSFVRK